MTSLKVHQEFDLDLFKEAINYHIAASGIKNELNDVIKQDLKEYLSLKCKDLTQEEIHHALKLERFGEWERTNHFHLFSVEYFSDILSKYRKWKADKKRALAIKNPSQMVEYKPTKEDLEKIEEDYLKVIYDELKSNGITYRLTSDIYERLDKEGHLNMSIKDKIKLFEKVKKKYVEELKYKRLNANPFDKNKILNLINNQKSIENEARDRCRAILFAEWSKGCLESFEAFKERLK